MATCYEQGPCDDGFMDQSDGSYSTKQEFSFCDDCDGGPFYINDACECACIPSIGCTSDDKDGTLPDGASAGIIIAALLLVACGAVLCASNRNQWPSSFAACQVRHFGATSQVPSNGVTDPGEGLGFVPRHRWSS